MFCTVDKASESWSAYFRWSTSPETDIRDFARRKMESIQIDHKTVINTIKLKPNPRRPGDFRTGTVKERPGGYNAAGDRCYVGLKTSLARCRKSPLDLKKNQGAGMFIHGPGWEGFKYIKSFMLEVCTVYILFSILYTLKLLRDVKAEEFLITNDKIKSSFFSFVLI